jgi:hypothetical protein
MRRVSKRLNSGEVEGVLLDELSQIARFKLQRQHQSTGDNGYNRRMNVFLAAWQIHRQNLSWFSVHMGIRYDA